jgi:hypothetical protein
MCEQFVDKRLGIHFKCWLDVDSGKYKIKEWLNVSCDGVY